MNVGGGAKADWTGLDRVVMVKLETGSAE